MPTTAKGFVTPAGTPDDNDNLAAIQAMADRMDAILTARTAAQITALAGTDLWAGRTLRQTDGTGTGERQQSGLYINDGTNWVNGVGDGLGGTATGPVLTAVSVNPNMGTAPTLEWDWWMLGPWLIGNFMIVWGTGAPTPGTGGYIMTLPTAPVGIGTTITILGSATLKDTSTGAGAEVAVMNVGASTARFLYDGGGTAGATGAAPLTLGAAGDSIVGNLMYLTT